MFGFVCPHSFNHHNGKNWWVIHYVLEAGLLSSAFAGRRIVFPSTSGVSRPVSTIHLVWR